MQGFKNTRQYKCTKQVEAFISFYKPICEWFKKNCF